MQRTLKNTEPMLNPSPQFYWLAGLLLISSLVWGLQNAIEDEAFLLFLADTVIDEASDNELTDPLHMIEHELLNHDDTHDSSDNEKNEQTDTQEAN